MLAFHKYSILINLPDHGRFFKDENARFHDVMKKATLTGIVLEM